LGGTGADIANAVASDAFGYAYITGNLGLTKNPSYEFPVNVNTTCSTTGGSINACPLMFVAELDPSAVGNPSLVYSSYLGGDDPPAAGIESARGIAVDGQGDVFVTGWEDSAKDTQFPLTGVQVSSGAVQQTDPCAPLVPPVSATYINECSAGFLVEFSPDASISYSTFLGVNANVTAGETFPNIFPIVQGTGVALDSQGDAYIAGVAGGYYPMMQTTSSAFEPNPPTDKYTGTYDRNGFLSVINGLAKPPLLISPTTLAAGMAGVLYSSVTFRAPEGQGTVTISESGNLPSGMTFSNGTLAGTPTQIGNYPIIITATDSQSDTGSENLTLVIGCPTITVGPSTLANGMVGTAYPPVTFTATGGLGTITFSETGLPAGMGMSFMAGVLSGTPTTAESFSMMVTATDSNGCQGNVTDTLTINSSTTPPATVDDNEPITVNDQETVTPLINFAGPAAWFSTSGLGFNGQSGIQPLTVSNAGGGSLVFSGIPLISSTSDLFTITQTLCSNLATSLPTTLPSGGACTLTISYAPSSTPTADTGTIVFTDNAALSSPMSTLLSGSYTQTITLNGGGTPTSTPPPPPATVTLPTDIETITVTDTPLPEVTD
ncbi:MAG: putative Ig domain-containing protein, partial [Candidatus Sulfotelmatobacter sp.]